MFFGLCTLQIYIESWIYRTGYFLEGQYQVVHGETNEDAILLRMARKYRRLLYHHRIIFFTKCNIDPEARPIALKYRAEYGVYADEKLEERCKDLLEEEES